MLTDSGTVQTRDPTMRKPGHSVTNRRTLSAQAQKLRSAQSQTREHPVSPRRTNGQSENEHDGNQTKQNTYRLAECMPSAPPRFGESARLSTIGRGSVGCEILCLREELVLERGSLDMELRPPDPDVERPNHFVGCVKSFVNPFEGDTERGVFRKLTPGDEGDGVVASGGLRVLEPWRRGAMGCDVQEWTWRGGNGGEGARGSVWVGEGVDVRVKIAIKGSCPSVRDVYLPCVRSVQRSVGGGMDTPERGRMRTEGFTERSASDWLLQVPF